MLFKKVMLLNSQLQRCCLGLLLATTFSTTLYAEDGPVFEDPSHCQSYPKECLIEIGSELQGTSKYSLDWYRLKQNQLNALFQIQSNKELKAELPELLTLEDAPPVFLTTVYTIHAKFLLIEGHEQKGREYVDRAVKLIKAVNEVSVDPDRYAEINNLYTYTKDWQAAKEFGLWAQRKIANIKNLAATANFHNSQGHIYSNIGELKQAEFHYGLALKGYLQSGNAINCAVGYHNLARTFQKSGRHEEAINHFHKAIEWTEKLGKDYDAIGKGQALMRLTQSYIRNNQIEQAQTTFDLLDFSIMPEYFTATYKEVKAELTEAAKNN